MIDLNALVLTRNEEANIGRALDRLKWVPKVLLIDSFSTDGTVEIATSYENTSIVQREFTSFADQCNFGLGLLESDWVLSLDADYVCTKEFEDEVMQLDDRMDLSGFEVSFRYCIDGIPLSGSLYPPRVVLYRRPMARYAQDGHAHRVVVDGSLGRLGGRLLHDDRKPLASWLSAQQRYAEQEARKLRSRDRKSLSRIDRLRKVPGFVPLLTPLYCLLIKGTLRDGRAGLVYAAQRTYAELLLSLYLLDGSSEEVPVPAPEIGATRESV